MSKDRINKFIFSDQNIFLRLKTTAKGLKVKKNDSGYAMSLTTHIPKRMVTSIPVVLLKEFKGEESIHDEALELGYEKDKSGTVSKATITCVEEKWGERLSLRTLDKHATYYYLQPEDKGFAVKVGPIFKSIDGKEIEIDWSNAQWGEA